MFQQFLIDLENKESNELAKISGVKIIGDSPVASPAADEWINQDLFLKGQAIGCPPDYFSKNGQRWGFKYFNPKYIFNPDGTLGKAGKILKEKYDAFFASFPGGLRIDHVIGLVDPFIYTVKDKKMTERNSGRIYSLFTGMFQKKENEYSNIMEKIVLQSAKEHGFDKNELICEDLGEPNKHTQDVMKKLDLSGIAVTMFDYRGAKTPEKNVIMIGSHDNESLIEFTERLFTEPERQQQFQRKTKYLAQDVLPAGTSTKEIKAYREKLRTDKKEFIAANFAELFTSPAKRIQIFFSDFWGIGKTYNRPGTNDGKNWILRIGNDFENDYYKAVSDGKAPNLARAIATALRQRGLDKSNTELMQKLDESAKILAEA
jgi:4-alpha-glucanotransferase